MAADTDQLNDLLARADKHQARLVSALRTLERRIVDLMAEAPLQDGRLFDLEWAIQARSELRQAIEQEYLLVVDNIVRDYKNVSDEIVTMLQTYGDVTKLDQTIISQLQSLTFSGFEDLGNEYLDLIAKQVYESTLTGTTFAASVAVVQELVGKDMARYASQQVHDALTQFDRTVNARIAFESGATKFKYHGPDDEATREFCDKHVNKIYTLDEMNEIWQGEWAGKAGSNPLVNAGGYNCRHRFRPVYEE